MEAATLARNTTWWATEAPPVRAVLDLADLEDNDTLVDLVVRGDADLAREIANLGADLVMIARLRVDEPRDVLAELYDAPWHGDDGDLVCDAEADRLEADVRYRAQLVASLLTRPWLTRPRRYDQCDETCTTDCGHCKGHGIPAGAR